MKKLLPAFGVLIPLAFTLPAEAGQQEFCDGFEKGYKSIAGELARLPTCSVAPVTPVGSTDFRAGLKAGIRAAQRIASK